MEWPWDMLIMQNTTQYELCATSKTCIIYEVTINFDIIVNGMVAFFDSENIDAKCLV